MEYRFRHKDGTWRVLESTASVIRDSKGEPEKLVIVNRDVTERKRAAEAVLRSETSFRTVVGDAPYGIFQGEFSREARQWSIRPWKRCWAIRPRRIVSG